MIDISDGLVVDVWHICEVSGCGATLDETSLDRLIHPHARLLAQQTGKSPQEHALYDGEDFELIVVLASDAPDDVCRRLGLTPLGEITAQRALTFRQADGRRTTLEIRGWEHFRA